MRTFAPALLSLLDAGRVAYAGMIRVDLGEGSFGIIQAATQYVYGGVTYKPVPRGLVRVSASPSSTGTVASGFTVVVSEAPDNGVTPSEILNWENYDYLDRPIYVYDLHTHPDTGAVLTDPVMYARGRDNRAAHDTGPEGHTLTLECEDRGTDYARSNGRQNNAADHQRTAPGDTFFANSTNAGRIKVKWGQE